MATEEVGIRLSLQGRREVAAGLAGTTEDLKKVGDEGEKTGGRVSRGFAKLGSKVWGAAKIIGKAAIAGSIALIGTALYKGFQRLKAIDQATAKLKGLGHSAKSVDKIMSSALKSVKGTAFGLDEAATVSATAVAAGIKPGRQLTKTLKNIADAATIGGTSMSEMGAIFNKVATSNKVQGDIINQLNAKGIPIVQLLGKTMHKTSAEVMDMSRKGEIGFAQFSKAMQKGMGGAALKSGKTFSGSFKNLMAQIGRIGAGLLGGLFPHLAPGIQGITKALRPLQDSAGKVGNKIGKVLGPAFEKIGPWITSLGPKLSKFSGWIGSIDFKSLGSGSTQAGRGFHKIGAAIKDIDWGKVKKSFGKGAADSVSVFSVVIGFLAKHLDTLAKLMPEILVAFAAFKVAQTASKVLGLANIPIRVANTAALLVSASANRRLATQMGITNGVEKVGMLTRIRSTVATVASTVASKVAAGAAKAWALAQRLLNAAMKANPIGIIITVLVLLVGGLILAYKKSETFRKIVHGALHAVGEAGRWLWNSALRPTIQFIIRGFALVMKFWSKVLGALGHVPGFGWAKKAAEKMKGASDKALDLANNVKKIQSRSIKITVDTTAASRQTTAIHRQIDNYRPKPIRIPVHRFNAGPGGLFSGPTLASGTNFARGGITLVGERGPELVGLPRGSKVKTAPETRRLMSASLSAPRPIAVDDTGSGSGAGRPVILQNYLDGKLVTENVVGHLQGRLARA